MRQTFQGGGGEEGVGEQAGAQVTAGASGGCRPVMCPRPAERDDLRRRTSQMGFDPV